MEIREDAQRNHDQLFPGHQSTLRHTDPELVAGVSPVARFDGPVASL